MVEMGEMGEMGGMFEMGGIRKDGFQKRAVRTVVRA